MLKIFLVFIGGGLGATSRYLVTTLLAGRLGNFPIGTFTANIIGSLLMGIVVGVLAGKSDAELYRVFIAVGFLGGFTTFSSFSAETLTLIQNGGIFAAAVNVGASVLIGLLACAAGLKLTQIL